MEETEPTKPPEGNGQDAKLDYRSLADVANVSHQKGDVPLITTSKDRFDAMTSPLSSLSSNFFTLMIGIALAIFIALESEGVKTETRPVFWLAFWFSLVLVIFFGIFAAVQEYRKWKFRKEFKARPSTPVR